MSTSLNIRGHGLTLYFRQLLGELSGVGPRGHTAAAACGISSLALPLLVLLLLLLLLLLRLRLVVVVGVVVGVVGNM
jgi:hypothetical protein